MNHIEDGKSFFVLNHKLINTRYIKEIRCEWKDRDDIGWRIVLDKGNSEDRTLYVGITDARAALYAMGFSVTDVCHIIADLIKGGY